MMKKSIKSKLIGGFLIVAAMTLIAGIVGISGIKIVGKYLPNKTGCKNHNEKRRIEDLKKSLKSIFSDRPQVINISSQSSP